MAIKPLNTAVFEATSLLGQEVRKWLLDSKIPIGSVKFFGSKDTVGQILEFDAEPVVVVEPDKDLLAHFDLIVLCGPSEFFAGTRWKRSLGSAIVADLAGAVARTSLDDLVVAHVREPAPGSSTRWIAAPDAATVLISSVLSPLSELFAPKRVDAVVFRPVSDCGQKGIEELHNQTLHLLNMQPVPMETLQRRIAFDLCPREALKGNAASDQRRIEKQLRSLFPKDKWSFDLTSFLSPVFFGLGVLLTVQSGSIPSAAAVETVLSKRPKLKLIPPANAVSPGTVEDRDDIFVTLLPTGTPRKAIKVWIAADNLRRACALNALEVLERVLTAGASRVN